MPEDGHYKESLWVNGSIWLYQWKDKKARNKLKKGKE